MEWVWLVTFSLGGATVGILYSVHRFLAFDKAYENMMENQEDIDCEIESQEGEFMDAQFILTNHSAKKVTKSYFKGNMPKDTWGLN